MKMLSENRVLIEHESELPQGALSCKELFMDHESTSFKFNEYGREYYRDHRICGTAVTWDDHPRAYYLPVRHNTDGKLMPGQIPVGPYQRWLKQVLSNPGLKRWSNHGIKEDMHMSLADGAELPRIGGPEVFCTLTHAKLLDTDRLTRGGYGLDAVTEWLTGEWNASAYERMKADLASKRRGSAHCKDYGHAAVDLMGDYACGDALDARLVDRKLRELCPAESRKVWQTETLLTPILFDMERDGERVDEEQLDILELKLLVETTAIEQELHERTGQKCSPHVSADCHSLLCGRYGLPVLSWTESDEGEEPAGNPSFDYEALLAYSALPEVMADPTLSWAVGAMMRCREQHTLLTYFVRPYREHATNGLMHPDYDQCKRTGRLGCRKPNMQQLSVEAKELVIPGAGRGFLCCDYSQIEFRLLVHYMNDPAAVAAYLENPDTDFHQWVADMCGIPRKPAKNVNFCMGYGGGKARVVRMLAADKALVGKLVDRASEICTAGKMPFEVRQFCLEVAARGKDQRRREDPTDVRRASLLVTQDHLMESHRQDLFRILCKQRGEEVYSGYHARLPGLRRESRAAASTVSARAKEDAAKRGLPEGAGLGWACTPYGRQRHLPARAAWLAMNSVTQGWAADVIKERTVALAPRYNSMTRSLGLSLAAQVHDENRLVGDRDAVRSPEAIRHITSIMERPLCDIRVPLRSSASWSDKNWRLASDDKAVGFTKLEINRSIAASPDPDLPKPEC